MSELYSFANQQVWGDERLADHYTRLQETVLVPHSEPRASQLSRELAHVAFEFDMRCNDFSTNVPVVETKPSVPKPGPFKGLRR